MDEILRLIETLARHEALDRGGPSDATESSPDDSPPEASETPLSTLEVLRLHARVLEEASRLQRAYLRWIELPAVPEAATPDDGSGELVALLARLRQVLLRHPLAAQEAYASLMAEGRRFADTPDGEVWRRRLAGSDVLRRGRRIWDVLSMRMFEDEANTIIPSSYVDALFRTINTPELEQLLLRVQGVGRSPATAQPPP